MSNSRQYKQLVSDNPDSSDRIFSLQNLWYFQTQEGDQIGPFRYRSEAQTNLDQFMRQLKEKLREET
ncbi:MAG: hypothetical protein CNF02_06010 [OM182 bacterium MED-G28]|uniref:DUF6316 domain-containing protein n=1 Tax=OM182 bacterium MED-G28 TaxID=1986256 RepID=A0A2A5WD85_9GAMM|nr:MAG: hypothetical protein CNF02_06010 [OM182 bacterium MED-G28]